ncbi:unnamed protein product [Mytilus coruscus]|uniref:PiggyBac transposable element-derived protein domain-containing protein n=1 Tax=Mytilus coruscus TaxID=42192 RepID=A0A6J8B4Y7_MYTCO|nr:unnamed protein product [Mytilus coruscus]
MPEAIKGAKLKNRGEGITMQKGNLVATAWKDKKIVNYLSTNCDPTQSRIAQRRQKDGTRRDVPVPIVSDLYNKFMFGVDLADQKWMQYSTCRKAKKWYKYLFWFCFDLGVVNSLICMQESLNHKLLTKTRKERKRTQLEYRKALTQQMIGNFRGVQKKNGTRYDEIKVGQYVAVAYESEWFAGLVVEKVDENFRLNFMKKNPNRCYVNIILGKITTSDSDDGLEIIEVLQNILQYMKKKLRTLNWSTVEISSNVSLSSSMTLAQCKSQPTAKFSEVRDPQHAFSLLRQVKQKQNELVQVLAERLIASVKEAYIGQPQDVEPMERQIIGFFVDGLLHDKLKIKIMHDNLATLIDTAITMSENEVVKTKMENVDYDSDS